MRLIICPGMHDPSLTASFLKGLLGEMENTLTDQSPLVFPTQSYPAYSAIDLFQFLDQQLQAEDPRHFLQIPLVMIAFSAGVVAAIATAWAWQLRGGNIRALIAIDGWGVPLTRNFPIHRMSHDYFTHWSSALLGQGAEGFYAEPAVEHLELWRSPQKAGGWQTYPDASLFTHTTAARFIADLIQRYRR